MFGSNAKGLPNDTAAVLTPFVVGQDMHTLGQPAKGQSPVVCDDNWRHDRPYYFNHTLPYGFFSRSPIEPVTGWLFALSLSLSGFFIIYLYSRCSQALRQLIVIRNIVRNIVRNIIRETNQCFWMQSLCALLAQIPTSKATRAL